MMVRVLRVGRLPAGLSIVVDEQPGSLVVWVLREDYSERQVARMEAELKRHCGDESSRLPPGRVRRATLHAV